MRGLLWDLFALNLLKTIQNFQKKSFKAEKTLRVEVKNSLTIKKKDSKEFETFKLYKTAKIISTGNGTFISTSNNLHPAKIVAFQPQ